MWCEQFEFQLVGPKMDKLGELLHEYNGTENPLNLASKVVTLYNEALGQYVVCYALVHDRYKVFASAYSPDKDEATRKAEKEAWKQVALTFAFMDGGMVEEGDDLQVEMTKEVHAQVEGLEELEKEKQDEGETKAQPSII